MADASAVGAFAVWFNRAFDVAAIVAVALWQVCAAGTALLTYLGHFRSPPAAVAVWAAQLLLIATAAILLLRRRHCSTTTTWLLAAADLATGIVMAANCPGDEQLKINWAWATVGLVGVLLLMHRPAREYVALLALNAGVVLTALVAAGHLSRHDTAGFVTLLYASASIQLALIAGARVFRFSGGMAAQAAAERWELAAREAVIAEVASSRLRRYLETRTLIAPILRGLAEGTVDAADPLVRRRCATAEAMLRQLLAEQEDVPDPVLRALRPGLDQAMRRGVVIDMVRVGVPPPMGERTVARLAEAPLAVLAGTRDHARVTVVGTGTHVSIAVLAKADVVVPPRPAADGVVVTTDHDGDLLWVEARWEKP
ncbi:hypothetical protein [Actinomadura macra]|uniref:hypothetical protein n=1 Tax=Actinomadura macra TaxID=46164 RepID=UPI00082DC8DD|nr:hypothetical protein [Actinomadura macra]